MTRTIDAFFEGGVLRPLEPLEGFADRTPVRVTVQTRDAATGDLAACVGTLPDDDAAELRQIISEEFERVDPNDW